jgi:predicted nucleotidyltransferase
MINVLLEEHQQMLSALVEHKVNFILIGGYAVIHYGYERTTGDMDIWLQLSNENRDKFVNALADFGITDDGLERLRQTEFNKPLQAIHIGEPPRSIDFLTLISNVKFEDALANVNYFQLENIEVPVIDYNNLILSKLTSNRLKDKADIEELQRINKYRNNQ